ncbi:MAG: site-specific integrase [Halioglobus sp.]
MSRLPTSARNILSSQFVKSVKEKGLYADGGNLYLQVSPTGTKSWGFKYYRGKQFYMGLGPYPDTTLAKARDKASNARQLILEGIDPLRERERLKQASEATVYTFKCMAIEYIKAKKPSWTDHHFNQFTNTLTMYVYPVIGTKAIDGIETKDVLKILNPIWAEKNETASRIRGRIEMVIDYGTAIGVRKGDNPARWKGHLAHLLPERSKVAPVQHHNALPYGDMPEFILALRKKAGFGPKSLELCILSAMRIGAVVGARWDEIDGAVWTIPAERMKGLSGEFKVPLSKSALALLDSLPKVDESPYLFPGRKGHIGIASPYKLLKKDMGYDTLTVHGFRSTFRDWSAEQTSYANHICEMALAHSIGSTVEKAYLRSDLFVKRASLMEDWAKFLDSKAGKVLQLRRLK